MSEINKLKMITPVKGLENGVVKVEPKIDKSAILPPPPPKPKKISLELNNKMGCL